MQSLTALVAAAFLVGCAPSQQHTTVRTPPSYNSSLPVQSSETVPISSPPHPPMQKGNLSLPATSALRHLKPDKNYIVLIDTNSYMDTFSRMVGFSGMYDHIEVIHNGQVYGCRPRPPGCSEISLTELEDLFVGQPMEIREVPFVRDLQPGIRWFRENVEGNPYGPFKSTDVVVGMNPELKGTLTPVNFDHKYNTSPDLPEFMKVMEIPKPTRDVYFPDQFQVWSDLVTMGVFRSSLPQVYLMPAGTQK